MGKRTRLWRSAVVIIMSIFLLTLSACGKQGDPIPPQTAQPGGTSTQPPAQPASSTGTQQPEQPKAGTSLQQPEKTTGVTPGK